MDNRYHLYKDRNEGHSHIIDLYKKVGWNWWGKKETSLRSPSKERSWTDSFRQRGTI